MGLATDRCRASRCRRGHTYISSHLRRSHFRNPGNCRDHPRDIIRTVLHDRRALKLAYGIVKAVALFLYGFVDGGQRFDQYMNEVVATLRAIPAALRRVIDEWMEQFNRVSADEQSYMIGQLVGRIIATLATLGFAAGKAGKFTLTMPRPALVRQVQVGGTAALALESVGTVSVPVGQFGGTGTVLASSAVGHGTNDTNSQPQSRTPSSGRANRSPRPRRLTTSQKDVLRREAREIYFNANPRQRGKVLEVDHRVPLEWAHKFPNANPNRLSNLRGLTKQDHLRKVSEMWTAFRNTYRRLRREPTASEILAHAELTDRSLNLPYPL